jgi:hypothetical protein
MKRFGFIRFQAAAGFDTWDGRSPWSYAGELKRWNWDSRSAVWSDSVIVDA